MPRPSPSRRIGVISDTHGLVRPEAVAVLAGSELLLHAGDIGGPEVLRALEEVAPVVCVRGNVATGPWARALPERERLELDGSVVLLVHDRSEVEDGELEGVDLVVCGHSHRPGVTRERGVLHLNPGSAGPRRFRLPVAVAHLLVRPGALEPRVVELRVG